MFDAVCAACGKACKVPFQPREDRPVYCIANMEADFQDTLTRCRRVEQTRESIWQGKKLLHLAGILLKFIAPLV